MPPRASGRAVLGFLLAVVVLVAGFAATSPASAASRCGTAALTTASGAATQAGAGRPGPQRVGVFARVPRRVEQGQRLSVCALVGTAGQARTVRLEQRVDGRWTRVATVRAQRRVVLRGPEVRRATVVRVTVRDARGRVVGASGARRVTVRAARTLRKKTPPRKPAPTTPKPFVPAPPTPAVPPAPPGPLVPVPEPDPIPGGSVSFRTQWRNGSAQIVTRTFTATAGTTRTLDVDGDEVADFSALVTVTGSAPTVDILPLGPSAPAAAVEAIVVDPLHQVLGRDGLVVGFDAVDGRSPDAFIATADAGDGLDLSVTQDAPAGQGPPVVAWVFDGTPEAPVDPVDLRVAGDELADLRVAATVNRATGAIDWSLSTTNGTPTGVAALRVGTSSATPFADGLRVLRLDARDVPATGRISAAGPVELTSDAGPIGAAALVASSVAGDQPPTDPTPAITRTATATTIVAGDVSHARVDGATVALAGPVDGTLALDLTGAPALTGSLSGLPASAELQLDFARAGTAADPQTVRFTGRDASDAPAGLDRLTFTASGTAPLLGRGPVVDGDLRGLPSDLVLAVAQDGATTTLDATTPGGGDTTVGSVRIGAADAPDDSLYPVIGSDPADGVRLRARSGEPYALGVRATELTSVATTFDARPRVRASATDGPFVADGWTDGVAGRLVAGSGDLADLDLTADLTMGTVAASAAGPVNDLRLDYATNDPQALGATTFAVAAAGLSADTTFGATAIAHPSSGQRTGVQVASDQPIDLRIALAGPGRSATLPATGSPNTLDLDATDGTLTLEARLNGLRTLTVRPQTSGLHGHFATARDLNVDAVVPLLDGAGAVAGGDAALAVGAESGPTELALRVAPRDAADGGGELTWTADARTSRLTVARSGAELVAGTDRLSADVRGVPTGFSTVLRTPDADATDPLLTTAVTGATADSGGPRIDELRIAAGSGALPPSTGDDAWTYRGGSDPEIAVKSTNLKRLELTAAPFRIAVQHEDTLNGGTKPLELDLSVPRPATPSSTALGISGTLDTPSFATTVTATPDVSDTPQLRFAVTTGTADTPRGMASLSLTMTEAGGSPSTALSLLNLPRTFTGCVAGDGACVATAVADLPNAQGDFAPGSSGCTLQPLSGNIGLNRPYAPATSFAFDDAETSGDSPAISSMVTINASVTPSGGGTPTRLTNVRVHRLRGDLGGGSTSFPFKPMTSIAEGQVPRFYVYLDSDSSPFVLNGLQGTEFVSMLRLGTDALPARASEQVAWVAGAVRSSPLGCSIGQNVSTPRYGGTDCGGASEMTLNTSIGTVNMFNLPLFGDVTRIC